MTNAWYPTPERAKYLFSYWDEQLAKFNHEQEKLETENKKKSVPVISVSVEEPKDTIPSYIKQHVKSCMTEAEYKRWHRTYLQAYEKTMAQMAKKK